jgi:hypothetical protein
MLSLSIQRHLPWLDALDELPDALSKLARSEIESDDVSTIALIVRHVRSEASNWNG